MCGAVATVQAPGSVVLSAWPASPAVSARCLRGEDGGVEPLVVAAVAAGLGCVLGGRRSVSVEAGRGGG